MAPNRKRAGQRVAAAAALRKWKVGDLVLAKVKGFPAWPATVGEPEKWGYSSHSKKVVVCFFGSKQIGFCNPTDLEEFTEEKKASLLGKHHGKGADFGRAVNEIVQCFEKSKKQNEAGMINGSEEKIGSNEKNSEKFPSKHVKDEATVAEVELPSAEATDDLKCETEAAVSTAAEESVRGEERQSLEISTTSPAFASDLTRNKTNSSSEGRKLNLKSRSALCVDNRVGSVLLPSIEYRRRTRRCGAFKLRHCSLRRSGRNIKLDNSEGQVSDLYDSVSDDGGEECVSEAVPVGSDTPSINEGCASDCCKPTGAKLLGERDAEGTELGDRLGFQIGTTTFKKRMRSRKRHGDDSMAPAKVEPCSDAEALNSFLASPCSSDKLSFGIVKEDGDEHLPLVKRARVRMAISSPSTTEKVGLKHEKQNTLKDPETPMMHSFVDEKPSFTKDDRTKSSLSDPSPTGKSHTWDCKKNTVDGESTLPPSKRIHRALEAMSANVAEDIENASCFSLTVSVQCNNDYHSAKECTELPIGVNKFVEFASEAAKDLDNNDSDLCAVSDVDIIDNNAKTNLAVSESVEIEAPSVHHEVQRESIELGEVADNDVEMPIVNDLPEKIGVDLHEKFDSVHVGEKLAPRSKASPTDQCKNGRSPDLKEAEQKSDSDNLQMNLHSNFMQEITGGPPKIDNSTDICITDGEGFVECNPFSLCEQDIKRCEFGEETVLSSLDSNVMLSATPIKVLDNHYHHQPLLSSVSCEYMDDRTISVTQSSSSVTDGPECIARASPPCSSKCSTSQSPYSFLHPEKQPKPLSKSSNREASLLAFESIIGTLTRTKDSIGRATRIAIDCANFCLANKVVEILADNLEREPNLHKKVNLFFLVDSIAQCSRSMKGDGGIYPSVIQAVLPRLLSAAAPPCSSSHENHRQCLKVLKVWLERKILPDPIIQHHIREIEAFSCPYPSVGSRRPLRNERAFDDPIRQMEGMLVDEYGSNSSIQLPGFHMPLMRSVYDVTNDSDEENPEFVEHNVETLEAKRNLSPIFRKRSCILEDVEGELEMEDVAPHLEDEPTPAYNAGADTTQISNHCSSSHNGVLFTPADVIDSKNSSNSQNYNSEYRESTKEVTHHRYQESGYFEGHVPRKVPDSDVACSVSRPNSHFSGRTTDDFPSNDAFSLGFHWRPPQPASSSQFSYSKEGVQSRRDVPPPHYNRHHRTRYPENGSFNRCRDRNKFIHRDNYWRPPYPYSSGPCYQDGGRMNHPPPSYGGPPREPMFPNSRWHCPPGPSNHRHVNHYNHYESRPHPC